MSFQKVCDQARRDLPARWQLRICLENGSGWVELVNPDGEICTCPDFPDASLEKQVNLHVGTANLFDLARRASG